MPIISSIIIALSLKVMPVEIPNSGLCGSYYPNAKVIIINQSCKWVDLNETLYHELGHALFLNDDEVNKTIALYPAPRFYYSTEYPTDKQKLDERVADYFAMYMKYPDFAKKFPALQSLFERKVKEVISPTVITNDKITK